MTKKFEKKFRRGWWVKMLQEGAQDLDGVGGVDGGAPGDDMGIDHPTRIEKRHDHLLGPTGINLSLQRARLTPWDPLLTLFFVSGV